MKKIILVLSIIVVIAGNAFILNSGELTVQPASQTGNVSPSLKMIAAKVFIKAGMEDEFIRSAGVIIANTRKESGCLEYTLYQDPQNKSCFLFFERYKDQSAIDAHFAAPYFKEFGAKISGWLSKPSEVKIYDISEAR